MRSLCSFIKVRLTAFILLCICTTSVQAQNAVSDFVLNGAALAEGDSCFLLTPDAGWNWGTVWYKKYIDLNENFDFNFKVFLGDNDGGADGIAFVLQPTSTGSGNSGGGLGYQGINPSVAIEYDTWQNGDYGDPSYDHIAIHKNGIITTEGLVAGPVQAHPTNPDIEDGQWHTTRITWNAAAKTLIVYFDSTERVTYTNDIISNIFNGNSRVYWGFTGATGGASNLQKFCIDSTSFEEYKEVQTILFDSIPDKKSSDLPFVLKATASSGLPVTYTVISGPANVRNDILTITGAGVVRVRAQQAGDSVYHSASAERTFTVKKADASVTLSDLTKIYNGSPQTPTVTTNPAGLPVAFIFDSSSTPPVNAGSYHVIATIDDANYTGSDTGTFVIQSISAPDLSVQNVTAGSTIIAPGDLIKLSWKVANLGTGKLYVDWTEKIYMQSATGENKTLLKQIDFTKNDSISNEQTITRNDQVNIPNQLNIGDKGVFVVELIPAPSIHEEQGNAANNTGIQKTPWTIKKLLTLELSNSEITEGSSEEITATVNRTGSLSSPLTFNINLNHPNRFSFPSSVTIPAGQAGSSFTISAPDNSTIEGTITDTMRITATNFTAAKANLTILDNDKSSLSISKLPLKAMEGETVTFQVTTNLALTTPLQVFLTSDNQARFQVPSSVTIPAGSLSATVSVVLEQDSLPEVDQGITITAGASNQNSANATIQVNDDDIPGLELIVQTNLISESAGLYATQATLRRTAKSNLIAFTANLSADLSNTIILPDNISLAAGESEKSFTIGVVDNNTVDGQRNVSITASIFVASCGCSAPPASSGSVSAGITVSDNDGSSLLLTTDRQTLAEGLSNAGFLRVTRNTATDKPLLVNISSSNTKEATIPATAQIPAGKAFVDVSIITINDGKTDGSQQVYFQASADGYSPGSVSILVTDLNKPDLQIPIVQVPDNNIQATAIFNYQISVKNTGFATAPSGVLVRGYLSSDSLIDNSDTLISEDTVSSAIQTGQTVQISNAVKAPNHPGQYKLLFRVNPDSSLSELLVTNNTSVSVNFSIKADYTATANVSLPYFLRGTTIAITGSASRKNGNPAANEKVEVYIITNGLRRTILATTNGAGHYTTEFIPLAKEAGHYTVGASFPGIGATADQDNFDILGVRIDDGNIPQFKVVLNDTLQGSLTIQNMSSKSLTNFTLVPVSLPNGASIRFETVASFVGNATIKLNYKVMGSALSPGNDFEVATLRAISKEGTVQSQEVFYFSQAPNGYVVADITNIDISASQSKGERLVEFTLVNKGVGATGEVTINLPQVNWLSSVTPRVLSSMATGDSAIVVLKFLASAEVTFNYPVTGSIGISTQNGNSFAIPFSFEKVSQTTGAVKVTVTNQFTYFTEGSPKVKGAQVQIKNYFSGEIYAEGSTDSAGVFAAKGIPEGKHRIVVEKDKHLPYENTITIDPGDTVATTAFLNYQAITFSWKVVPTAVQDEYDITLESQFETNVPMPVVTIDMPKMMPQLFGNEVFAFNVTLTNHGLIAAKDVALNLPQNNPEYEFVMNYVPADLLPQQSIQVPVQMRRRIGQLAPGSFNSASVAGISQLLGIEAPPSIAMAKRAPICVDVAWVVYWYKCNLTTGLWERNGLWFTYKGIFCSPPGDGDFTKSGHPPCATCPEPPNFWKGGSTNPYKKTTNHCAKCITDIILTIGGCATGGWTSFGISATSCAITGWVDGWEGFITCIPGVIPGPIGCLYSTLNTITTCLLTETASQNNSINALSKIQVQRSENPPLGAAFEEIAKRLQIVLDAYTARENWGKEYFGNMIFSDSWKDLAPQLEPYVINLDSIRPAAQASILAAMAGYEIQQSTIQAFFTRWNTSIYARSKGVLTPNAQYPNIINWTLVKAYSDSMVTATEQAIAKGFKSVYNMYEEEYKSLNEILDGQKNEVCASVKVQFSQQITMTREAFEGTLDIFNGHPTDAMDSLSVTIQITDADGVPSNGLFEIQTKSLTNLKNITGKGNIAAQQNGTVKFLFIPELGAAPTEPKEYKFGGYVRYWDPYAKAMVTLPLASVPITVNPSPNLMLHYFMQRNILGDDALTKPDIEPSVPAELAVMVENQGYGSAVNMTISSAQPKIVDNEKGLAINFNLVGSNFQGQPKNLGVTDINFGTIPALQTRIGQWYFTSSILGKFVSYEARVVHANSFGNPDSSLVKGVKLHELTKSIRVYGGLEDGVNDFLVNDIFDVHDVPDMIYYSQGNRTEKVYAATTGSFSSQVSPPAFTNTLTITASKTGWNYIKLVDPGNRQYDIVSITRSDGQLIPVDNAWLTFVTLPVSQSPVYENKFHFVDSFTSLKPITYTVIWKPRNFDVPKVLSIEGAPEQVTSSQVKKLKVVFDKSIDPTTFTYEDLVLTFQGGPNLSDTSIVITQVDTATFNVDLSKITTGNGFYALTVQAANVTDIYGIRGLSGKQVTWSQFLNVPMVQAFQGIPEGKIASAFDKVQVLFNLPIDVTSVTPERFTIVKDSVLQQGSITIDSVRADKKLFYLSGLKNLLTQDGTYEFMVDLPKIKSVNNVSGVQTQSVTLTVDKSGPLVLALKKSNAGGLDLQHVTSVNIQFSEEVAGFNTASVQLTRNGEVLPLNIDQLSSQDLTSWIAGNFGMLTYPEGDYVFKVNLNNVKDAAGNKGSGSKQVSWTVSRSTMITITKMTVTPDLGFSGTDRVTSGDSLNVTFNLSANASQVTISQYDLSGEAVLAIVPNVAAGDVSFSFAPLSEGNTGIRVRAAGVNGEIAIVQDSLFIDPIALTGKWLFDSNQVISTQIDTIAISFSAKLLSNTGFFSAIQFKRNGVLIPRKDLRFKALNDTVYHIYGLRQQSSLPGDYELILNLESFSKFESGKAGTGHVSALWTVQSTNEAPIAKAGNDFTITAPGRFTLNGSASSDPDSDSITYRWIAPAGIVLSDSTSGAPSFNITTGNKVSSYSFLLIVSDGELFTTDVVNVVVNFTTPPVVKVVISCPLGVSYSAPGRIKINASVIDIDSIVKKVQFYSGTTLLHTEDVFPYGFLWVDVPVGNYTLTAKAFDNSGNVVISNTINLSVVNENVPPVVSIVNPVNDTTYTGPATIRLIANAKDPNDRISKVEFYNGATLLRTEYYYPYTYTWTNVQSGTYNITAKAYDDKGLSATSPPVTVTVTNAVIVGRPSFVNSKTDLSGALNLTLSPNPARSTLQIFTKALELNKPSTISVISTTGVVIKTIQSNASNKVVQLDVSSLVSGVYTVKVISGDKNMYKQFVKL